MRHSELYADGVGQVTVGGGVVRVDLVSLSPTECDANNKPKPTFRQRLVFPVEGFANSVEVMQRALQGMVDMGVIQAKPSNVGQAAPSFVEQPRLGTGVSKDKH